MPALVFARARTGKASLLTGAESLRREGSASDIDARLDQIDSAAPATAELPAPAPEEPPAAA